MYIDNIYEYADLLSAEEQLQARVVYNREFIIYRKNFTELNYIISGTSRGFYPLFRAVFSRIRSAFEPTTARAHHNTFTVFFIFMNFPMGIYVHNILTFLEYLDQNGLSPKVITIYLSSRLTLLWLGFSTWLLHLFHICVSPLTLGVFQSTLFGPTNGGVFDIRTLYHISRSCDNLSDPVLYRAIF